MLPADKLFETRLSQDVWATKYSNGGKDVNIQSTMWRVARAVVDPVHGNSPEYLSVGRAMIDGILMPAGRIVAGAGTGNRVTLMNCYVMGTVEDSLDAIFSELNKSAMTMQQGGGIGTDFSTLRPEGALLKRTGSYSSGPLPFMDTWDAMCRTIMSAGHRRGAMMGTLRIDHPDIRKFIKAKRTAGRMTNFNVSILATDAFMRAVQNDDMWHLHFPVPKAEWSEEVAARQRLEGIYGLKETYVYEQVRARDLWEEITRNTYEYSEPGVIFIDQINATNNLNYCETISCTNPCGEQPLPPYGACDLGHINLAMLIKDPFTPEAAIHLEDLRAYVRLMVRFLDNVIDVTGYPLNEQENEQKAKRRIGLGITGLGDALCALGFRYGSAEALEWTDKVMKAIAVSAYVTSADLAVEKGPFPLWDKDKFNYTMVSRLSLRSYVHDRGLRNGVLLTVAPTGTMSSFYGNTSGGCEPIFSHRLKRKVRQPDDSFKEYFEYSLTVRAYAHACNITEEQAFEHVRLYPDKYPTVADLSVDDHVAMQAACQRWVDASISKTVNIPVDMPYEDFKQVYTKAYMNGCKGCTTYRPSKVRGSILEDAAPTDTPTTTTESPRESVEQDRTETAALGGTQASAVVVSGTPNGIHTREVPRPKILSGQTAQIKWPHYQAAVYVTINEDEDGKPCEMFISSKNAQFAEWSTSLSVMVSKLLRLGQDPKAIAAEMKQITLAQEPAWIDGTLYRSIIAMIGQVLEDYVKGDPLYDPDTSIPPANHDIREDTLWVEHCEKCGAVPLLIEEGCKKCLSCGHSKCG